MSKNTLEVYVREFNCLSRTGTREDMKSNMSTVTMELSPEILSKLEKLKGEGSWNVLMKQILNEREEWLEKEKPMKIKTKSKHVPVKIAKYVKKKTNNTCAFPGCCKKAVEDHHADRHSLSKMHDPEKIVPLCRAHHRLAHLGLIENEDLPPEFWEVRRSENLYDLKALVDRRVQEKIWKGG